MQKDVVYNPVQLGLDLLYTDFKDFWHNECHRDDGMIALAKYSDECNLPDDQYTYIRKRLINEVNNRR